MFKMALDEYDRVETSFPREFAGDLIGRVVNAGLFCVCPHAELPNETAADA
jgi:hypothetical protein